jgi:prepilin-type N-terminal cleavage/methylation domain-containing protein
MVFNKRQISTGFTIVELLIVIVVIGILAAIVIVAYNGIQQKAQLARVQSDTSTSINKLELYRIDNNIYPTSITDCPTPAATNICLTPSSDESFSYMSNVAGSLVGPWYMVNVTNSYELTIMSTSKFLYTSSAEKTGVTNEFLQYVDLAPIINRYGLTKYQLSFDIKSASIANASSVRVYFQNGSDSRYGGLQVDVTVTTSYSHQIITFTAAMGTSSVTAAMLAFYGTYGSGNVPTVKNLQVQLAP